MRSCTLGTRARVTFGSRTLHVAMRVGWYMQTGPQGGQRLGAVVGCGNACEQRQLMLMEMVLGCQPPPGYSLGQVRKLSGRLLPLAVRALATAPGILGMFPQGPAPGKSPEWGRSGLAPMPPRR